MPSYSYISSTDYAMSEADGLAKHNNHTTQNPLHPRVDNTVWDGKAMTAAFPNDATGPPNHHLQQWDAAYGEPYSTLTRPSVELHEQDASYPSNVETVVHPESYFTPISTSSESALGLVPAVLSDLRTSETSLSPGQPGNSCTSPNTIYKCPFCNHKPWAGPTWFQNHVNAQHISVFKRRDSHDYICRFCLCNGQDSCRAIFDDRAKLSNHLATKHSDLSDPGPIYDHACDSLLPRSNLNEAEQTCNNTSESPYP